MLWGFISMNRQRFPTFMCVYWFDPQWDNSKIICPGVKHKLVQLQYTSISRLMLNKKQILTFIEFIEFAVKYIL